MLLLKKYPLEDILDFFRENQAGFISLCLIVEKVLREVNFSSDDLLRYLKQVLGLKPVIMQDSEPEHYDDEKEEDQDQL